MTAAFSIHPASAKEPLAAALSCCRAVAAEEQPHREGITPRQLDVASLGRRLPV